MKFDKEIENFRYDKTQYDKILYSPKYDKHPKSSKFWNVNWDKKYSKRFGRMKINFDAEYGR